MKIMMNSIIKLSIIFNATLSLANAQSISPTFMPPMKMIYVTDTAAATQEISQKMGKAYGLLFTLVGKLQLRPLKSMGIFHTGSSPWIFDIAVEVDKEPERLISGVKYKQVEGGEAIVVHYKGAYEQVGKAYQQIDEWLKINRRQKIGPPIEVYLNNPATVKDKNELQTDIYQLIQ
jgi:effector-binding domain-containing protein